MPEEEGESSITLLKSLQLNVVENNDNFKYSRFYIITHVILFSFISLILIYFEYMLSVEANYLTRYLLIASPLNIMIGIFCFFISILSLYVRK
jgi:hypothetical protein